MKNLYALLIICSFILLILPFQAKAYVVADVATIHDPKTEMTTLNDFVHLSKKELKQRLGRNLTFRERLSHLVLKNFLKKFIKKDPAFGTISINTFFQGCAKIALKNGDIIEADIISITPTEVKYKRCGKSNDPEFIINKSDVLSVQSADGEIIFRNSGNATIYSAAAPTTNFRETEPLAIWALVSSLLIAPVGLILGIISLGKISRNPTKYKGKGLAWAGIAIGGLWTLLVILAILAA
ncbi:MAG: DUF4190 domain-containing protein [Saprospiraceae bacterium]